MKIRIAILALALMTVAGCGSSPKTNFYALDVAPAPDDLRASAAFPVQVVAVHVPPTLDRQEMVRKLEGQSVKISDTDRWSAPFGDMIRNVLSQDLQARLPRGSLILPQAPAPSRTAGIVVDIADFSADAKGHIELSASWSLLNADTNKPMLHRNVELYADGGSGADAVAGSMSHVLGRLADDIASGLASVHA